MGGGNDNGEYEEIEETEKAIHAFARSFAWLLIHACSLAGGLKWASEKQDRRRPYNSRRSRSKAAMQSRKATGD